MVDKHSRADDEGNDDPFGSFLDDNDVHDLKQLIEKRRWWKGLSSRLKLAARWLISIAIAGEAVAKVLEYLQQKSPTGHP